MIFTSTMAADIVFYAMIEWALYAQESYLGELGSVQKWASTFPLFHWGPIAWGFYIMLAVAFGFMYMCVKLKSKNSLKHVVLY